MLRAQNIQLSRHHSERRQTHGRRPDLYIKPTVASF